MVCRRDREAGSPVTSRKIHLIAAARPNFMKIAPLYHALKRESWCRAAIVHTGQHYDYNMSESFFRDLKLPEPDFHLEVGSGSHAEQTGRVMIEYEKIAERARPDWIIVVGDVNSTLACALVGTKLCVPVVHLEAGLRSGDRRMPEEINRLATDAIADVLWTPSADADVNLLRENVPVEKIDRVGNFMIDSYEMLREAIAASRMFERMALSPRGYAVVTLHRPANVDSADVLASLIAQLSIASAVLPMVFAVHPRTRKRLEEFGLMTILENCRGMRLTVPLAYIEFMNLVSHAAVVVTDSGGVQEETTYLGIPCLTLRATTERPITIEEGSNRLVKAEALTDALGDVLNGRFRAGRRPALWDGKAAQRAVVALRTRAKID
ncbi:MAG TPA: UDP-N-acetylglucosamine 2-epimerase (non-hydrolyzing) [Steroidobacteraceae bacterium]|nr:UDP-N-acetylglucosamine 2-epimerase (non-hydrolyzing) [Steroidobacteraceae bacterium]